MKKDEIFTKIKEKFPSVEKVKTVGNLLIIRAEPKDLIGISVHLKEIGFDYLSFMTTVDLKDKFEMIYFLETFKTEEKIILKINLPREKSSIPSISSIWKTADWHERECRDMFGIDFIGHNNLKPLLLPDGWKGFPLRKDYVHTNDEYD